RAAQVALHRAREAPRAPGAAERKTVQDVEAHRRVRRSRVRAADDRDVVPARGEERRQAVEVALGAAALRVAQVHEGEMHRPWLYLRARPGTPRAPWPLRGSRPRRCSTSEYSSANTRRRCA